MIEPNVITVTELAREQECSRQAIYDAIKRGDLSTARLGSHLVIAKDKKYAAYKVRETGGRLHKRSRELQRSEED